MEGITKKRVLVVAAVVGLVVTFYCMNFSSIGQPYLVEYGNGNGMLDMHFFFNRRTAEAVLIGMGHQARNVYRNLLLIDLVFIVCLAHVMVVAMEKLVDVFGLPPALKEMAGVSYIRAGFDVVENTLILLSLQTGIYNNSSLTVAGVATLFKWISMFVYILALLYIVVMGLVKMRKNKQEKAV